MKIESNYVIAWETWEDPGASDGGGARVPSYSYPSEINGGLVISGDASEEMPAWFEIFELVESYSPVESVQDIHIAANYKKGGAWRITALIDGFDGEAKDRD